MRTTAIFPLRLAATLLGVILTLEAAQAQTQNRSLATVWIPERIAEETVEAVPGKFFLQAQLLPVALGSLDRPVSMAGSGSEILPSGTKLFQLKTVEGQVYCTVHGSPRWGALRRAVRVHVCLVDADRDDRFESYYDERADHAILPLFRGSWPAKRQTMPLVTLTQLPVEEYIKAFADLGIEKKNRLSMYLRWDGPKIICHIGYPAHRILGVPLTEEVRVPKSEELPATVEVCGAKLTILARADKQLRLKVDRGYPASPTGLYLPWQLF